MARLENSIQVMRRAVRLKGLSGYGVIDEGGDVKVWSIRMKRWMKILDNECGKKFFALHVKGKTKYFSAGFLRFLMRHPEIDASLVCPRDQGICFADDGTVKPTGTGPHGRRYSTFRDIDDALYTVLVMKAALDNDLTFVISFMEDSRNKATATVAKLLGVSPTRVSAVRDDADELFIRQLRTARCERIIPLFAWYCRCIKSAYLESLRKVKLEEGKLDGSGRGKTSFVTDMDN